jgi:hypothetical protein
MVLGGMLDQLDGGYGEYLNELHFNRRGPVPAPKDHGQRRIRSHHVRQSRSDATTTSRDHETATWATTTSGVPFRCTM